MILLAGGAGYIGSHANKMLNSMGYETIVYDSLSRGHRELVQWGNFVQGDLADKDSLRNCFSNYHIDAVMHYGALIEVGESVQHPSKYYRNNVLNTLNLLDVMAEYKVKYFIFSSSCAIYQPHSRKPIAEDQPQQPLTPYGKSKFMVEKILEDYDTAYGIRYASLRYFNAAGADPFGLIGEWHNPETHLVPLVLQAAAGMRDCINIYGTDYDTPDGTCIRDYVHVNDLAAAHILALQHVQKRDVSDVFNLANTRGYSVREVIETARLVTGRPIVVVEKDRRPGDADILIGDADKARNILGWKSQYPGLEEIIQTAWTWQKTKTWHKDTFAKQ
ncbi:MAG: UDP-glucose 4-epimerase GalE [Smithellaceae bacterium]|jgi:UDP-glucose 4-epimerase